MYFKKLIILTALLIAMLTLAIVIFINDPQSTSEYINYPFPGNAPGDKTPYLGHCYPMEQPLLFCLIAKNSIVYDTEDSVIIVSTIKQENLSTGYLISQWGEPISAFYYKGQVSLVFEKNNLSRMAVIYTSSFEPTSKVAFIVFKKNTTLFRPYRGFYTQQ